MSGTSPTACPRCGATGCGGACACLTEAPDRCAGRALWGAVDAARDVVSRLGLRAYTVHLVRTKWSGGARGLGLEGVVWERPILPTPAVQDVGALRQEVVMIGTAEAGSVRVSEVSPRYTEADLSGLEPDGSPVPEDESVYWEVRMALGDPLREVRRRFVLAGVPSYDPTNFEWVLQLTRARDDRTPVGEPPW